MPKNHHKALQRHSTGEAEKYYQKRRPVTGFKHIHLLSFFLSFFIYCNTPSRGLRAVLLQGNVPALAFEIVTAFWKKEKVTVLPHLLYSLDLALCDFFMFLKLK